MNALIPSAAGALTMSSREIADLVEARHDNVKRTIETLATRGVIESPQSEEIPTATKPVQVFRLGKRDSLIVVAQLCPEFTARIVDRWQELEQQAAQGFALPDFTDPAAAAMAWADQYRAKQALQLEAQAQALLLAEVEPKAKALDRLATPTDGAVCLRIAAKLAQVPEKQFFTFLNSVSWIFRHHHSQTWAGYSDKERAGLLELKKTRVQRDDGSEKVVEQVLITPKGLAKIVELIERKAPGLRKTPNTQPTSLGAA